MFFSGDTRQLRDIMFDLIRDSDIVDLFFDSCQFTMRDHALYFGQIFFFYGIENFLFICKTWIVYQYFKQESIDLRLRERISSFLFYRILSSQHKERVWKFMCYSSYCHLMFLHCFQQSWLNFWSRSIDFICENYIRHNWSHFRVKRLWFRIIYFSTKNICRQKIRSKLYPFEI